jgi:hypothetical protein
MYYQPPEAPQKSLYGEHKPTKLNDYLVDLTLSPIIQNSFSAYLLRLQSRILCGDSANRFLIFYFTAYIRCFDQCTGPPSRRLT